LLGVIGKVDSVAYNFTFAYLVHGTFDTKQFWGVNIRFQAKLAKSKNVRIINTATSISKMADGRHLEKIEKSPYLGRG